MARCFFSITTTGSSRRCVQKVWFLVIDALHTGDPMFCLARPPRTLHHVSPQLFWAGNFPTAPNPGEPGYHHTRGTISWAVSLTSTQRSSSGPFWARIMGRTPDTVLVRPRPLMERRGLGSRKIALQGLEDRPTIEQAAGFFGSGPITPADSELQRCMSDPKLQILVSGLPNQGSDPSVASTPSTSRTAPCVAPSMLGCGEPASHVSGRALIHSIRREPETEGLSMILTISPAARRAAFLRR